jgi:hypothetical protein
VSELSRFVRVLRVWLRHNRLAMRSGSTSVAWWEADRYVTLLELNKKGGRS